MGRARKRKRKEQRNQARHAKAVARGSLFQKEEVVTAATPSRLVNLPKYVLTLGLYEFWRRRNTTVVTDQRILFGSGVFNRSEQSIPLKNVMDVAFRRRGLNSYAEVAVTKRGRNSVMVVGPMSGSGARRLASEIQRRT
jgi:hypothetical protein